MYLHKIDQVLLRIVIDGNSSVGAHVGDLVRRSGAERLPGGHEAVLAVNQLLHVGQVQQHVVKRQADVANAVHQWVGIDLQYSNNFTLELFGTAKQYDASSTSTLTMTLRYRKKIQNVHGRFQPRIGRMLLVL